VSNLAIRRALETKFVEVSGDLPTEFENGELPDNELTAEQEVYLLFAEPDNPTMGDGHYRQSGIMQITLRYPLNEGSEPAALRAELLRLAFHRGLSVSADGVTTHVHKTPEIGEGRKVNGKWVVVVKVRFYADIF
jgi:hypothetical protein